VIEAVYFVVLLVVLAIALWGMEGGWW